MRAAGATSANIAITVDGLRAGGTGQAQLIGAVVGSVIFSLVITMVAHLYFRRAVASR